MDREIKDILIQLLEGQQELREDINGIKKDVNGLKEGQKRLEIKIDKMQNSNDLFEKSVVDYFEKIDGNMVDIKKDINRIESATADNWSDIARIKKKVN